jgi:hypothetical protein
MRTSARILILALLAPWLPAATLAAAPDDQSKETPPAGRRADDQPNLRESTGGASRGPGPDVRSVQIRPRERFSVSVDTDRGVYGVGDAVTVRFRASEDCVVYIFNTDSDGVTRQIFPNYYDRENSLSANRGYSIPNRRYWLVTTGPSGRESLHIVAYRRNWRALEPWNEFRPSDPFPRRAVGAGDMQKRVEKEAREADPPKNDGGRGGGLRIVPVPRDDYAEAWAHFEVRARRYDPYDPYDP